MIKGFALNDDRFINGNRFDTRYFDELLKFRIKQDREYISSMNEMYKKYLEENKK